MEPGILRQSLVDASLCIATASSEESGKVDAGDPGWKSEKRVCAKTTIGTRPRGRERERERQAERNGGREMENKRERGQIKRVLTQIRRDSTTTPLPALIPVLPWHDLATLARISGEKSGRSCVRNSGTVTRKLT